MSDLWEENEIELEDRRGLIEVRNDLLACPEPLRAIAARLYLGQTALTPEEAAARRGEMNALWETIVGAAIKPNGDVHEEALDQVLNVARVCGWTNPRQERKRPGA